MPRHAPTPCRHPNCAALVHDRTGYCSLHAADRWRQDDAGAKYRQAKRGHMATNLALWRGIRHRMLLGEPLCRECTRAGRPTAATCVDHIDNDPFNNDDSNLQPLCASCHSRKTARDQNRLRSDSCATDPPKRLSPMPDDFTF
jgi:5-methylcytosine-specific restriction protein A